MSLGCGRVVERVEEARPVHPLLLDAVDVARLRHADRLEDGRADVDDVRELRPETALLCDPLRPVDDHRVAGAAEMRGNLLSPLERTIAGPGPGRGVVRAHHVGAPGLEAAPLERELELLLVG